MYFSCEIYEAEMLSGRVAQPEIIAMIAAANAIFLRLRMMNL
jgi:hypothetical protein